jgi:hypothetical protein
LLLTSKYLVSVISPFMLFLVFISSLTMPHAFFMQGMYKVLHLAKKPQKFEFKQDSLNIV